MTLEEFIKEFLPNFDERWGVCIIRIETNQQH